MKITPTIKQAKQSNAHQTTTETPWPSLALSFFLLILNGIQFSIYMTSAWPYLKTLDHEADLRFFGWVMAAYSFGQMISSWLFGYWNQKTLSTRHPAICGLALTIVGNILYGMLPLLSSNHKWYMLLARLLTGWGSGTLSIIRSYCAMASTQKDRTKAVSLATGSFVLGISVGPTIQSFFIPFGVGNTRILSLRIDMYTAPAFAMVVVCLIGIFVLAIWFRESYAGIISKEILQDPFVVIPKFDRIAAFTLIYLCFVMQTVATGIEVISTPLTVSLYNWTNEQALFYNGLLQMGCSIIDFANYGLLSFTKVRNIDKRLLLFIGVSCFTLYQLLILPWPFYDGPLDFIQLEANSTVEDTSYSGGCHRQYEWCSYTTRVPFSIYAFSYIVLLGFGFPYISAPTGIIFSEVLGPRKQGMMQGLFAFFGSLARCVTPLLQTILFKQSGYVWPNLINFAQLVIGLILMAVYCKRLVPLKMTPKVGVATRYKHGIFYHL